MMKRKISFSYVTYLSEEIRKSIGKSRHLTTNIKKPLSEWDSFTDKENKNISDRRQNYLPFIFRSKFKYRQVWSFIFSGARQARG